MVSIERGLKNAARPVPLRPNTSLMRAPSIWMELKRLFWPTAVIWDSSRSPEVTFSVTNGEALIRSAKERSEEGLAARRELSRFVPAPVAPESRSLRVPVATNFSSTTTSDFNVRVTSMSLPSSVVTSETLASV